jgi:hypothetical protein
MKDLSKFIVIGLGRSVSKVRCNRLRNLSDAQPIVAVDHHGLAAGNQLAIQIKFNGFVGHAIQFNDRTAPEIEHLTEG